MKKTKLLLALFFTSYLGYAQVIYTIAGTGTAGSTGDNGLATSAQINNPEGIVKDGSGNVYFSDTYSHRVRKISTTGVITTIAGTGTAGFSGDGGAATSAKLNYPCGLAFDGSGNLYIADASNARVRKVNSSGTISTFAGTGTLGWSGDGGAATLANLNDPYDVAVDGSGNVFICDLESHVIRKVNTSGTISTIAGNGSWGFSGDGGPATSAQLKYPAGIDVNSSGDVYIADASNDRVRKVSASNGYISTVAGTGTAGYTGDGGAATSAQIDNPASMAIDASGNIYFCSNYKAVRKITVSNGFISTVIGNGTQGHTGDGGSPTAAEAGSGYGIYIDGSGNYFLCETQYNRIRKVSSNCPANAGPNKINQQDFCNAWPGVQIGDASVPNMSPSWSPNTNISSTTIAQPTSTYITTSSPLTYTLTVTGTGCTTATSTVQVTAVANTCPGCCRIMAPITSKSFSVFPNPSSDKISVILEGVAEYFRIEDITGKVIFEVKNVQEHELTVDLSAYNKGIYFITGKIDGVIEKSKLIKE